MYSEARDSLRKHADGFEALAIGVLEPCFTASPAMASDLLFSPLPCLAQTPDRDVTVLGVCLATLLDHV